MKWFKKLFSGHSEISKVSKTNHGASSASVQLQTSIENTVTDIDGNVYRIVTIRSRVWMAENLRVTHYRNGDAISKVTGGKAWENLRTGAYCEYDNNAANVRILGRLYNWYAINDSRNIAPAGWHVPTDAEWQTLVGCLGVEALAGGKMKEKGTAHWNSPNTGATNESGFSALPGGYRCSGEYFGIGVYAYFWSSSESTSNYAWDRRLKNDDSEGSRRSSSKDYGFSVRCVKD